MRNKSVIAQIDKYDGRKTRFMLIIMMGEKPENVASGFACLRTNLPGTFVSGYDYVSPVDL